MKSKEPKFATGREIACLKQHDLPQTGEFKGSPRLNRSLVCLLLLLLTVILTAAQQTPTVDPAAISVSPSAYRVGEKLSYNVTFANFVSAAHVDLLVAGRGYYYNRDGIELRAHVETTELVNAALYAINNDYLSYVDPSSGQPYRAVQVVRKGSAQTDPGINTNLPLGNDAIPARRSGFFAGTYDFLSALYRFRSLPLAEGATFSLVTTSESAQYNVQLKVTGRELVKTNVGSFNSYVAQIRSPDNSRVNDLKLTIYFSDDERHVPVLITARQSRADVRVELAATEFLDASQLPGATSPPGQPLTNVPPGVIPMPGSPTPGPPRANGDPASADANVLPGLPFKVGEQLNFNVYLGNNPKALGIASFQVKPRAKYFNHDGIILSTNARTVGAVGGIFTANDAINSYVDPTTVLPFRTELRLQEGRRVTNQTVTTDQDRGTAVTDRGQRLEVPVGTHDVLSVLYALRSFNLNPPKRNAVSLLLYNRSLTLFVTSLKREKIELNGKSIPAILLSITTDDPQPDKYAIRMWIGDDARRIPLRLTATSPLGPVRADLAIIPVNEL